MNILTTENMILVAKIMIIQGITGFILGLIMGEMTPLMIVILIAIQFFTLVAYTQYVKELKP